MLPQGLIQEPILYTNKIQKYLNKKASMQEAFLLRY
ncbi:hypothetical protein BH11BAC5_BH11BAC5_24050 [soil metagenome]